MYQRPAVPSQPVRLLPRPVFLAGREDLLADLHTRLEADGKARPKIVALCGLGGSGKTSVALEYAHRHLAELRIVWQFPADEPAALTAGFGDLAAQLGVRNVLDAGDPVAQAHSVLAAYPADWLLIFDNAPGIADIRHMLPPAGRGRVLVTSQDSQWSGTEALEVPVLDRHVATGFLQARTGNAVPGASEELAAELGGLPLALEQAAAYMLATGRDISGYLDLLRQQRASLLARGEPTGYDKQVATTWKLAFDHLQKTAPEAISLLRLLACCAPDNIPLFLLLQPQPGLSGELPSELVPLLGDALAADDGLAALRRFSLVSAPHNGSVSVHRLVQAVTMDQLNAAEVRAWRHAAGAIIEAALPGDPSQPETWPTYLALLPHAEVMLPAGSQGMARLGDFLGKIGNATAARIIFQQMVESRERIAGPEHPSTLTARAELAYWIGRGGNAAAARDQLAALLPVRERVLGSGHPDTLATRDQLARWTGQSGNAAAARDQLAALLPLRERVLGPEHPDTLVTRVTLAAWTGHAGDAAAAREQYKALLPVRERVLGPDHPNTLITRSNLAAWTGEAGDANAARDQLAALVPVIERLVGPEHVETLCARANLAYWTGRSGNTIAARDQFAALVPVRERVSGPEHPETLTARANLARWTGEVGDAAAARDQLAALVPVRERVSGPEHPETLTARANLARWTGEAGDAAAARDQFAALLPVRERVSGYDHRNSLATRRQLVLWATRADETSTRQW